MIGILAYGSLISEPGQEIEAVRVDMIPVQTPFEVEYARKSKGRAYAPTLVPVGLWQGGQVNAQIFVLKPGITEGEAANILYRRERDRVGDEKVTYSPPLNQTIDTVLIERLSPLMGIDIVFFTRISANLPEILDPDVSPEKKARLLACLAAESLTVETYERGRDGIQYLANNILAGVITPLTDLYKQAILQVAGNAPDLVKARLILARLEGLVK